MTEVERRPKLTEFMTKGYALAEALAILDRWDTLSAERVNDFETPFVMRLASERV